MGRERRRHSRIYVEFPVELIGENGLVLTGTSVNVSFGGCLVLFDDIDPATTDWDQPWTARLYTEGAKDQIWIGRSRIQFDVRVSGRLASGAIGLQYVDTSYKDFIRYKNFLLEIAPEEREAILTELNRHEGVGEDFMSNFADKPLGQIIQILYNVDEKHVMDALDEQDRTQRKIGDILVSMDVISQPQLDACLSLSLNTENTLFSHAFLAPLRKGVWGRHFQVGFESFILVLCTIGIMHGLAGLHESGLISLFLVSTALTSRLNGILQDTDLAREATDLLSMFVGMLLGYVAVAISISATNFYEMFGFVLDVTHVASETTIWNRPFSNLSSLLVNNCFVLISLVFLAFMYRGFAVLLTMSWNACTWGLALTLMVQQGITASPEHLSSAATIAVSVIALTPHLALEALAYIFGSIAAIGVSKSFLWHSFMGSRFRHDMARHGRELMIAAGFLLVAAVCEGFWVSFILKWFSEAPT